MYKKCRRNFVSPDRCYWLTIGIGNNTLVEAQIKKMYPQCKIFGVDNNPKMLSDFEKYGTPLILSIGKFKSESESGLGLTVA